MKKALENLVFSRALAEGVGFEPTAPLRAYLISSQGRYDHFDNPPYKHYSIFKAVTTVSHSISSQGRYDHFDNPPYGAEKSAAENQPHLKIQHFARLVNH